MSSISRRTVLRGVGVAMALPWFESLPVLAGTPAPFPKRFAVLFMGNGISGNQWWAKGTGAEMTLGKTLAPLEALKSKINVINGLFNKPSHGRGIHPAQTGNLLSGVSIQPGPVVRSGVTIDQVLADHFAGQTPRRSFVLSCEQPLDGLHETSFSLDYSSHISWQHTGQPVTQEGDARVAFDTLFENRGVDRRASIIDRVKEARARLRYRIGAEDTRRLDAYLTGVREAETRIERTREDVRERMRLMCDIIALAFQTDNTRVASLVLARDLSSLRYPSLDVGDDHHTASHDDLSDGYERIARFHVSQLAYLAVRLDGMPEGDGTVLDNSCVLWLSNMWSGWKHDNMKLPVVTAGGLGGTIATGRSLEYLYAGDDNRKLCSLYLSVLQRMGVSLDRFGDATTGLQRF
jgi:Protein of unknown function (DUF1552)